MGVLDAHHASSRQPSSPHSKKLALSDRQTSIGNDAARSQRYCARKFSVPFWEGARSPQRRRNPGRPGSPHSKKLALSDRQTSIGNDAARSQRYCARKFSVPFWEGARSPQRRRNPGRPGSPHSKKLAFSDRQTSIGNDALRSQRYCARKSPHAILGRRP
jgi:hypothetical protein